jgi:hypothetical protein
MDTVIYLPVLYKAENFFNTCQRLGPSVYIIDGFPPALLTLLL